MCIHYISQLHAPHKIGFADKLEVNMDFKKYNPTVNRKKQSSV